ncbi:TRAP transporter substrate-binding protein [Ammoniphilus sp. YIM 78166]|uniref:TRAP transporter substrate-binding protein n=1 Tax=Ammoniphilus sp. YIM 78166 TaxID=1644106 RepID=UPI00106F7075|nr:TRAP transporter substrate-binding protein [Ammoniphilus sp. YIM 78166]
MKKNLSILALVTIVLLVISGCTGSSENTGGATPQAGGNSGQTNDEKFTIKIGHVLSEDYHYTDGAKKFKELVEVKSNGRLTVEIYPNAQLGNEREMLDGMKLGTLEMGIISSGPVSGFVPEFALLDLGYLFKDGETAQKILYGPIGDQLNEKMIQSGFRRLAYLDAGFRNVYAQKPIDKPEDLKGLKIRTLETPAHLNLFNALGASPMPMGYSELYTALQQGVVDAAENVPEAYQSSRHFEVTKVYSETKHVYLTMMYLVGENFYQKLPQDLQEIVTDAALEATKYENELIKKLQTEIYAELENNGITVHKVEDLTPFINLAKSSWTKSAEQVQGGKELLEEILKEAGQTLN